MDKVDTQVELKKMQKLWGKVYQEIGFALQKSEKGLRTPTRMRAWSPEVSLTRTIIRYWKNRIANVLAALDGQICYGNLLQSTTF